MTTQILVGDAFDMLKTLPDASVDCCVTSPPYYGLRDYGVDGQIGLEDTPQAYVERLVAVFAEVRRVLKNDGTLWLNLGDSYAANRTYQVEQTKGGAKHGPAQAVSGRGQRAADYGLKPKDLIGIPWRVAFALQAGGWWLRQLQPWVKRNPMPESTRDRPTVACETVFMMTKSERYWFDYDGMKRRMADASIGRLAQDIDAQTGSCRANGGTKANGAMKAVGQRTDKQRGHSRRHAGFNERWDVMSKDEQRSERAYRNSDMFYDSLAAPHGAIMGDGGFLAFDVPTMPFKGAHFATMPARLAEPMIRASCRPGGTVLDPFGGAGTTALAADRLQRNAILIELNPEYAEIARDRLASEGGLFAGLPSLRGKNLACWCEAGEPCHADVLIEIANRPVCEDT